MKSPVSYFLRSERKAQKLHSSEIYKLPKDSMTDVCMKRAARAYNMRLSVSRDALQQAERNPDGNNYADIKISDYI